MFKHTQNDHLLRIRHSASHVMAQAVLEKFPEAKLGIGPAIENGFYYDFDLPRPLTPEDLVEIEARMKEIIAEGHDFIYQEISEEEARKLFVDQPYKLELIEGILAGGVDEDGNPTEERPVLSIYRHGSFVDLCRGPHVSNTREINPDAVKLLSVAGAYWRGDERRPMLQRIYGTAWETPEDLQAYLAWREEVERRDHRRLIKELDLISFHEEGGAGLAYWHPKGGRIRQIIEDHWRARHREGGYEIVYTPHIGRSLLWERSGHLQFYKENMYAPIDIEGVQYYLKPMNCPFHILIYKSRTRSYRDLPLRWAELGAVYRFERSGVLHGLLRVRGFTQDDAHIFCTPEQIEDEILGVLDFSLSMLRDFGFEEYQVELSVRDPRTPEKYAGRDEMWEQAERSLVRALEARNLPYKRMEGEAVFYGPKIDIKIKDALGRAWQCTTIQFDFNLAERFDLTFRGPGRAGAAALPGSPGPAGEPGAVLRGAGGTLRGRISGLAGASAGSGHPHRGPTCGLCLGGGPAAESGWPEGGGQRLLRPDAGQNPGCATGENPLYAHRRRSGEGCGGGQPASPGREVPGAMSVEAFIGMAQEAVRERRLL